MLDGEKLLHGAAAKRAYKEHAPQNQTTHQHQTNLSSDLIKIILDLHFAFELFSFFLIPGQQDHRLPWMAWLLTRPQPTGKCVG